VPFGVKTAQALARYLRVRSSHPLADSPALWLGRQGVFSHFSVYRAMQTRAKAAGLEHLHPTSSGTRSPMPGSLRAARKAT